MTFEWDDNKAAKNFLKHGVSFQEAATVFGDLLAISFDDPDHSENERRFLTFGMSRFGRFLVLVHTSRGEATRIISARTMNKNERSIYEEG